jgi:putative effector of murein hydrolase
MLFVPAGVGVIAYLDIFKTEALPILAAVIGGTAITLFVTAIVVSRFGNVPAKTTSINRSVSRRRLAMSALDHLMQLTWTGLAEQPVLETGVTVFAFLAATRISRIGRNHPLLNPTLLAIIFISLGLELAHVPYQATCAVRIPYISC